jgi:hypothetical protein
MIVLYNWSVECQILMKSVRGPITENKKFIYVIKLVAFKLANVKENLSCSTNIIRRLPCQFTFKSAFSALFLADIRKDVTKLREDVFLNSVPNRKHRNC